MKFNRALIIVLIGCISLFSVSFLLSSCSKNFPTAPVDNSGPVQPVERSSPPLLKEPDLEITNIQYQSVKVSKLFSPSSGDLLTTDLLLIPVMNSNYSYYWVPDSALLDSVTISVQVVQGTNSLKENLSQYNFLPEGMLFNASTELVHHAAVDSGFAELWWFNESTGEWEFQVKVTIVNKEAIFKINHFSNYTITEASPAGSGQ